jgi:Domain of unknown function (DUF4331)
MKASRVLAAVLVVLIGLPWPPMAWGASHREAPLIALDPAADITDVYAFRSWEDGSKVVFIMNVIPSQVPASGPNFFNFDDNVLYTFHFDLNGDGRPDDAFIEFRFTTEIRSPFDDLPISYGGVDPVPGLPPAITSLDGPGSAGLGLRQRYSVRFVRDGQELGVVQTDVSGKPLFAVPSNVGPRTMPNYAALASQGIYDLGSGIRVFAGQREETFYIDLGSTFDTLNFRASPPVLTDAQDANDAANAFGIDDGFEGLNINTIAIEVPIALAPQPVLGMYASTKRPRALVIEADGSRRGEGPWTQVARMGNPLVNELIIGTGFKDFWNATAPEDEVLFSDFYTTPRLASLLNAIGVPIPATPRNDLVSVLLQYASGGIRSELLRLDMSVPATAAASQKRLTVIAHNASGASTPDPAGWPNGRRPNDDVTDIALRVVSGILNSSGCCSGSPNNRLGDGVNFNRVRPETPAVTPNGIALQFPFLPLPNPGRSGPPPAPGTTPPNQPLFR